MKKFVRHTQALLIQRDILCMQDKQSLWNEVENIREETKKDLAVAKLQRKDDILVKKKKCMQNKCVIFSSVFNK